MCEWEGNLCPRTWTRGAATERVPCICTVFASVRGGLLTASPLSWGPRLLACGLSASGACGLRLLSLFTTACEARARGCRKCNGLHLHVGLPGVVILPVCFSIYRALVSGWGGVGLAGSSSVSVFQVTCPAAASWMTIRSSPVLGTPPGEHLSTVPFSQCSP